MARRALTLHVGGFFRLKRRTAARSTIGIAATASNATGGFDCRARRCSVSLGVTQSLLGGIYLAERDCPTSPAPIPPRPPMTTLIVHVERTKDKMRRKGSTAVCLAISLQYALSSERLISLGLREPGRLRGLAFLHMGKASFSGLCARTCGLSHSCLVSYSMAE